MKVRLGRGGQHRWLGIVLGWGLCGIGLNPGQGQEPSATRLANGLFQLESRHLRLITDMPITESVVSLPKMFDQAVEQWCERLEVDPVRTRDAMATAYLMVDRPRFVQLNLMPAEAGNFRHGYQYEDQLFVTDQPSDYYRRHLLLHEGTHWFCWKYLGGNGPPWYSEGICELLGTHDWEDQQLKLAVIPDQRERYPYWGRLKIIRDALDSGTALTLNAILQFSDTAHRTDAAYAWSWAAMVFFMNHPKHRVTLREIATPPLDYSNRLTIELKKRLAPIWPLVEAEWQVFLTELDFGFSPTRSNIDLDAAPPTALQGREIRTIRSDLGWQSTGMTVQPGQRIRFESQGAIVLRPANHAAQAGWPCEPQGITLQYENGHPIGCLIATIVPIPDSSTDRKLGRLAVSRIGRGTTWSIPERGILLLKVNESSADVADNTGEFTVSVEQDAS